MVKEYVKDFMNKNVRVIVGSRIKDNNHYNVKNLLKLEGILDKENDTQIFLKDMHTFQANEHMIEIETAYGTVPKDRIISLYSTPEEKQAKIFSDLIRGKSPVLLKYGLPTK